ncbi:hypothetical protein QJS66_19835 [Kocuria rhizophila]|nr:hypothetical protein QJS66_19835 [Kocuria rhizophila]
MVAAYGRLLLLRWASASWSPTRRYLKPRSDLSGWLGGGLRELLVQILAGIRAFAALASWPTASGVGVDEVATSGIGLAFIAFPAIIPSAVRHRWALFLCPSFAGFTSLISIVEVIVAACGEARLS